MRIVFWVIFGIAGLLFASYIEGAESGEWKDVPVGYCGTGAKEYPIQPNQDYTFLIPLWPFAEKGTRGIVGLSGTGIKVESKPFETSEIQKIARKE